MDTCFLFSKHLDEGGCFCLKLSQNGEVHSPPEYRTFTEIQLLQAQSKTLIVETTASASLLDLELPWLPEKKARIAIPYALEDKIAQPLEELHFAFDKLRYKNNHYLVSVIETHRIHYIISILDEHEIKFDVITLDWFALATGELCINDSVLLIDHEDFKGALSGELARIYLKNNPLAVPLLFADNQVTEEFAHLSKSEGSSYVWIAQKLQQSKPLNLCQGSIQHGAASDWLKKGYVMAAAACLMWLLSLIVVNAISLHSLNKQTAVIDEQIAVIYREFFPDAKQIISPKFRISQLLGSNINTQSRFWFLLNQFAKVINDDQFTIEQLRYQNNTLSVTLVSNDFASLEKVENKLRTLNLKINQTQAATRDQQVVATLELM